MTSVDYSAIHSTALIALASLILRRARLTGLSVDNREQAIAVIRGVRPAPSRRARLDIKPCVTQCTVCHAPLRSGELCDSQGRYHIKCQAR